MSKSCVVQLGYLPENPPLYPEMTVDEYLLFCGRLHRVATDRLRELLSQTKERCGLDKVGRRLIGNLSKGYKQRVGIAQSILHQPRIVILDEPTSGLDPNQIHIPGIVEGTLVKPDIGAQSVVVVHRIANHGVTNITGDMMP